MALIGNVSVLTKDPGRAFGGTTISGERSNWGKPSAARARFTNTNWLKQEGVPHGYGPRAYVIAQTSGGLASDTIIAGAAAAGGALAAGKAAEAALTGAGTITGADLALIVSAVAALAGTGTLAADAIGKLDAAADLAGAGTLTGPLGALAGAAAIIAGAGTLAADTDGPAFMSADVTPYTDLSPESLARAVWAAEQAGYLAPGTFGYNLDAPVSSIGGGSITEEGIADAVWDEAVAGHTTDGSFGRLVQRLLTVAKYLGLR